MNFGNKDFNIKPINQCSINKEIETFLSLLMGILKVHEEGYFKIASANIKALPESIHNRLTAFEWFLSFLLVKYKNN